MPQMSPINWLILMIYFSLIIIMFNSMIYSTFNYSANLPKIKFKIQKNWKW
uniref:ATP synthase complex subunit 8 n=1 Tax=Diaphanes pectinealis TaxID=370597 RepID=A0A5C0PY26_9COLE|nr:ATP synthase F0 subunit 8 [Diaphanes pectinealis]QEJ81659.1 ATP synthase F0 subunit 8 [Diaphanes pectinealis]